MKKLAPHDGSVDIPMFHYMDDHLKQFALAAVRCECNLTGWWSRIDMSGCDETYPAIRCMDCKRVYLINSFSANATNQKYADRD